MIALEREIGSTICIARLSGEVDAVTTPAVREALDAAISQGCRSIVLDLAECTYLDSSALGLLVWADHRLQPLAGTLLLAGARRDVARILELSGLIGVAPSVSVVVSVEQALAGLCAPPERGEPLWMQSFEVQADARLMAEVRSRVAAMLEPLGLSESTVFDIKVATGEALANAIRHGSPAGLDDRVGLVVAAYDDRVEILVSDSGCGFDGHAVVSQDVFAPSGRGVLFMRALMDAVEFSACADGGTSVRLAKRRTQPVEGAA